MYAYTYIYTATKTLSVLQSFTWTYALRDRWNPGISFLGIILKEVFY